MSRRSRRRDSDRRSARQGELRYGSSDLSLALPHESVQQVYQRPVQRVEELPYRARPAAARVVYPNIARRAMVGARAFTMPRSGITAIHSQRPPRIPVADRHLLAKPILFARALTCVKRKQRREVLHALGKVGRRGTGSGNARYQRRYRFKRSSFYSCGG